MKKTKQIQDSLHKSIENLSSPESYNSVYHEPNHGSPMPSVKELHKIVDILREVLFPGYFGNDVLKEETISYYTGVNIDKLYQSLTIQIRRGLCFACSNEHFDYSKCEVCDSQSEIFTAEFIETLPEIRRLLSTDIQAAYNGDPAAKSYGEIIFCYPVIKTLINYRIAHQLIKLGVPLIPRIISEMAHSETGIDIHPEAEIGEYFTIDHGTGVVIGATCIIGRHVQIYQGVTLGAKSFPLDEHGNPIKGIPRHPIVEDNVIIYSNATILGRITIGKDAIIGGNVWVTNDVPVGGRIVQSKARYEKFEYGAGI
ncbi:MAG: serine acetyltransferase [Bacteroidales bacterium]|jgi:serine O-acetyltransferase|nr:serine acetyltransferase [Bacteroidales bacterium]